MRIDYHAAADVTSVLVFFHDPDVPFYYDSYNKLLKIPKDSYLRVNGNDFTWYQYGGGYYCELEGKPTCSIEFKDLDGTIYTNTIVPPDTAYFIDFPDTVSASEDIELQINPPLIDSNEVSHLCLDGPCNSDLSLWIYSGTDSTMIIKNSWLDFGIGDRTRKELFLKRSKTPSNPQLPMGGGSIVYNYVVSKVFYVQ